MRTNRIPVLKDCAHPDGCDGVAHTKGLCLKHYQAKKKAEKKAAAESHPERMANAGGAQ